MRDPLLQINGLKTELGDESNPVRVVDGMDLQIRRARPWRCWVSRAAVSR
ncbi:hypothetical protein Rifp1Sym_bg00020 [endosymbiont of Riftia pachyptila (vent Ph05)]|uniref:Uncharacterized protein n=1 Tax=endosymbiont of Riftia pachyptila (vent Ph05) TaxID=1048808 RepID=G2DCX9_9GAMM|nr:hypothetical protein Rifp1Sym_bg00020 [endosymbiont of Riftia pachyptila (vent Ph05)]